MLTRRRLLGTTSTLAAGELLGCRRLTRVGARGGEFDVCVVGSGFAGTYLGLRLVEHGARVLMLEAGDFANPGETVAGRTELFPTESAGEIDFPAEETACIAVGGASLRWRRIVSRLAPEDFETRSRFGLFADWPIRYAELEPYYCMAERAMGVRGGRYIPGAEPPRTCSYPHELPTYEGLEEIFARSDLRFAPIAVASRADPAAGFRLADVEIPSFLSFPTAELRTSSPVTRAVLEGADRVREVETRLAGGITESMRARYFVIAAGPIESARLLLASRPKTHPQGVGNQHGLVGAHFTAHPRESTRLVLPPDFRAPGGLHRTYSFTERFRRGGAGAIHVDFRLRGQNPGFGLMLELEPERHNCITLDGATLDFFGRPAARIRMDWSAVDVRSLERSLELREQLVEQLEGAQPAKALPDRRWFHPAGTCRMAARETDGVVDPDGRVFGIDNLFVTGSSVFPTSGSANPTLTIVALAYRLADHLLGLLAMSDRA